MDMMEIARDKLIVALDVPDVEKAKKIIDILGDSVTFYKIGMELIYHGGLELAEKLKKDNKKVFIDAKLHDIPRTVLAAARNIAKHKADFLTLHCNSSNYKALQEYRKSENNEHEMKWCFVTVLTSEDDSDLKRSGITRNVSDHVKELATQAITQGADGIVASAKEAKYLRSNGLADKEFIIITPGIRPAGYKADDQKRITTPTQAIKAGSDYLVVGRPIVKDADPKAMAEKIVKEIHNALSNKQATDKATLAFTPLQSVNLNPSIEKVVGAGV